MAKKWWEPRKCYGCGKKKQNCCPAGYCRICHKPGVPQAGMQYCPDPGCALNRKET